MEAVVASPVTASYTVVTKRGFDDVLDHLFLCRKKALDTETQGLRPYHGDRLFSIIIACGHSSYYFNFNYASDIPSENLLTAVHLEKLKILFSDPDAFWYMTNAKYDMAILANEGFEIAGEIHCTMALGRVEDNSHFTYGLDECLQRLGRAKDDSVEKYIQSHGLYEKREIPGKATQATFKFFDRVPFSIIAPYGCSDGRGTYDLGEYQATSIERQSQDGVPGLLNVQANERRLTKTIFRMERVGVRIDRDYTLRAARFASDRAIKATQAFEKETGRAYVASAKTFAAVFESEKDLWAYTEKGNPSFTSEVLKKCQNPAAKYVLEIRDAKSKVDFFNGFLYHADSQGDVHPHYNPHGAAHGRFSSSEPNFQNLTAETILICNACKTGYESIVVTCGKCQGTSFEAPEFLTRRAIIPRPGFVFFMPDYDTMEYRHLFELACRLVGRITPLAQEVRNGKDVHQATADLVTALGTPLIRSRAKNGNFALLFGAGDARLAETIGGTVGEAKALRASIFSVAPEVNTFIRAVISTAQTRKWIFNWFGRKCRFPIRDFAYSAVNHLVSGGCADINKIALNRCDEYLLPKKSRMVMTVHDEIPTEIHESELAAVPRKMVEIMETVYPWQYIPLTCGAEWSDKSLADKIKGYPV